VRVCVWNILNWVWLSECLCMCEGNLEWVIECKFAAGGFVLGVCVCRTVCW
jgi:hypothetical protein